MHESLRDIPDRILDLALISLKQAVTRSALFHMNNAEVDQISILNAAHAGELVIKAIIAREHPLLLFKNLFDTVSGHEQIIDVTQLLRKCQTHDFSKLPDILWATTGQRLPEIENFHKIRSVRNQIQHFLAPSDSEFSKISLQFIFETINPLLLRNFGLHAIEFHEDDFPDYIINTLIYKEIPFTVPPETFLSEICLKDELASASREYRHKVYENLSQTGTAYLLS